MKRIYAFLFVMLCTLTASAEWQIYLISDNIFEPKKVDKTEYTKPNGEKISMYGYERKMVDDDGMVLLTGKYQYMQITNEPFALLQYDDETGDFFYYYAYDWYYETVLDPETNTYVPAPDATYWYGQWYPWGTQIQEEMEFDENGNMIDNWGVGVQNRITNKEPWQCLWWTGQCYTEKPYNYFSVDPGLYIVSISADEHGIGPVLIMYRICRLDPIPLNYQPHFSTYYKSTESNVNVNVWYTYYTITGGRDKTYTRPLDNYIFDGSQVFEAGEYAGCRYVKLDNIWKKDAWGEFYYPAEGANSVHYYIEESYPKLGTWYKLSRDYNEYQYNAHFSNIPFDGGAWLIWDLDGKRVKFLNNADFQKALADATGVASTLAEPATAPTYSLDGKVVTNPEPGQVYIQDGKKIFVK